MELLGTEGAKGDGHEHCRLLPLDVFQVLYDAVSCNLPNTSLE